MHGCICSPVALALHRSSRPLLFPPLLVRQGPWTPRGGTLAEAADPRGPLTGLQAYVLQSPDPVTRTTGDGADLSLASPLSPQVPSQPPASPPSPESPLSPPVSPLSPPGSLSAPSVPSQSPGSPLSPQRPLSTPGIPSQPPSPLSAPRVPSAAPGSFPAPGVPSQPPMSLSAPRGPLSPQGPFPAPGSPLSPRVLSGLQGSPCNPSTEPASVSLPPHLVQSDPSLPGRVLSPQMPGRGSTTSSPDAPGDSAEGPARGHSELEEAIAAARLSLTSRTPCWRPLRTGRAGPWCQSPSLHGLPEPNLPGLREEEAWYALV